MHDCAFVLELGGCGRKWWMRVYTYVLLYWYIIHLSRTYPCLIYVSALFLLKLLILTVQHTKWLHSGLPKIWILIFALLGIFDLKICNYHNNIIHIKIINFGLLLAKYSFFLLLNISGQRCQQAWVYEISRYPSGLLYIANCAMLVVITEAPWLIA